MANRIEAVQVKQGLASTLKAIVEKLHTLPKRLMTVRHILSGKSFVAQLLVKDNTILAISSIATTEVTSLVALSYQANEMNRQITSLIKNNHSRTEMEQIIKEESRDPDTLLRWVEEIYEGRI